MGVAINLASDRACFRCASDSTSQNRCGEGGVLLPGERGTKVRRQMSRQQRHSHLWRLARGPTCHHKPVKNCGRTDRGEEVNPHNSRPPRDGPKSRGASNTTRCADGTLLSGNVWGDRLCGPLPYPRPSAPGGQLTPRGRVGRQTQADAVKLKQGPCPRRADRNPAPT